MKYTLTGEPMSLTYIHARLVLASRATSTQVVYFKNVLI